MINWLKNSRRTATRGRFIPWQFDCDPKVPFVTVRGPDGFSLVVQVEDFTNLFRAFMTNYGHLQWPVTMAGFFNPPIQVANAIEFAFAEILVRMTPEGYCQVNAQQSEERSLLDMSFEVSLGTVCFFGGDRILQKIADEAAKGVKQVPKILKEINKLPPLEGESNDLGFYDREWQKFVVLLQYQMSQISGKMQ